MILKKNYAVSGILIGLLCFAVACSPIRKSQVKLIGNYFNTVSAYPGHIKRVNELKANLILEANNLKSAIQTTDSARIRFLLYSIDQYEAQLQFPDSVAMALLTVEQYLQSYYVLVPNGFDAYKALKGTTESIGGFFGLRSVISTILPDRQMEVTASKRRKIYRHFKSNRKPFLAAIQVIDRYMKNQVSPLLTTTFEGMKKDVEVLFEHSSSSDDAEFYFKYNLHFLKYFQELTYTRELARQLALSLDNIQTTESEVQRMTNERKKITKDSRQVHRLVSDLERISHLIQQIDKPD